MALATHHERDDYCDGQPMTDKDINRLLMEYVELTLQHIYAKDKRVYVSANLFVKYGPAKLERVAPDVFLVRGVSRRLRTMYDMTREKRPLEVAFEFVSTQSKDVDAEAKRELYERLGVDEYYVFDSSGELMSPRFRVFQREEGVFKEIPVDNNRVHGPRLGLDLVVDGKMLYLYDPVRRYRYPLPNRLLSRAEKAKRQATQAAKRARTQVLRADAEARRAKFETERAKQEAQRAEHEAQRAAHEARRAQQETQRAEQEAQRADLATQRAYVAEAQLESLRRHLRGLGSLPPE